MTVLRKYIHFLEIKSNIIFYETDLFYGRQFFFFFNFRSRSTLVISVFIIVDNFCLSSQHYFSYIYIYISGRELSFQTITDICKSGTGMGIGTATLSAT